MTTIICTTSLDNKSLDTKNTLQNVIKNTLVLAQNYTVLIDVVN